MKSKITNIPTNKLQELVNECNSIRQVLTKLGYNHRSGGSWTVLTKRLENDGIDLSKLEENKKNTKIETRKKPLDEILVEHSTFNRGHMKRRLIDEGILEYKCDKCGIDNWNGEELSLHIDHKNGINDDNRLGNLRLLCPNCHSQTPTYSGKNKPRSSKKYNYCIDCETPISTKGDRCKKCAADNRSPYNTEISETELIDNLNLTNKEICNKFNISEKRLYTLKKKYNLTQDIRTKKFEATKEELEKLINEDKIPYTLIGKLFGVSDNAIRKRAKKYGIIE